MKKLLGILFSGLVLLLTACTIINTSPQIEPIIPGCSWLIAPFVNNTEVPQAGNRAMSITANVLRSKGVLRLNTYPVNNNCDQLSLCSNNNLTPGQVLNWAAEHNIRYVMMGSVNEWQYKVGLDGEPVTAVSMQIYDSFTHRQIWSSVGSKTGNSRSGLANTAQGLINNMLKTLRV